MKNGQIFRVGSWQNGFFVDFHFWAAGFFRGFSRRIFSPHFCGKKCPEKSSRKIPGKILQNLYYKNPRHISAEGVGQKFASRCRNSLRTHLRFKKWEKDDNHDQDFLSEDVLYIWSWSSENLLLKRRRTMTMTKIPLRKTWYTYGHGPLIFLVQKNCQRLRLRCRGSLRVALVKVRQCSCFLTHRDLQPSFNVLRFVACAHRK